MKVAKKYSASVSAPAASATEEADVDPHIKQISRKRCRDKRHHRGTAAQSTSRLLVLRLKIGNIDIS